MKKIKKIFALLMTVALVMGLNVTAFAAGLASVSITINNAGEGKFTMVKVVEPDSTKDTGWDFVEGYEDAFLTAFEYTDVDADTDVNRQTIIKGMIYAENEKASEGKKISRFSNKYAAALKTIADALKKEEAKDPAALTVSEPGLYVIQGFETNYVYSPMAVFVGMDMETGTPDGLLIPAAVNAKKQPRWTEKEADDPDKITEIGRTLTYTATSTVPYFAETEANKEYWVSDVILKGAEYVLNDDDKLKVTVQVGTYNADDVFVPNFNQDFYSKVETYNNSEDSSDEYNGKSSFALDLTEALEVEENIYANQTIKVSYQATVTDVLLHNDVMYGRGAHDSDFGYDSEKLVTAKVTFVKKGELENGETVKLNGAVFVLTNGKEGNALRYASFTTDPNDLTAYKFAGWLKENAAKDQEGNFLENVKLTTGGTGTGDKALGKFTVSGLDYKENGDNYASKYQFVEIEAPDGYSINEHNATITWDPMTDNNGDNIPDNLEAELSGVADMTDTKLASLPGTGGIGTTIFTIGGCVIMIVAAGLFFATRKKAEK